MNAGFEEHQIPMDVMWLDIEHTNDKRYFTWDAQKFPNSIEMINELAGFGRKLVTIVDPHPKSDKKHKNYPHINAEENEKDFFSSRTRVAAYLIDGCWLSKERKKNLKILISNNI